MSTFHVRGGSISFSGLVCSLKEIWIRTPCLFISKELVKVCYMNDFTNSLYIPMKLLIKLLY